MAFREFSLRTSDVDTIFPATGEMGPLCRAKDWASTPLGPVARWPDALKTCAALVARQGFAMNLCWGPDLLQIYNDAYRVIMAGRHPAGLGRSVLWSWGDIRDRLEPKFKRVFAGETLHFTDSVIQLERNGQLVDAHFAFSYSPVLADRGAIAGALVTCYETTEHVEVRALQADRNRLIEALQVERGRLAHVFHAAPSFLAVLRGPDHVYELVNDAYDQVIGYRDIIGKPVREALPELRSQGFIQILDQVLRTGVPYVGHEIPVLLQRTPGDPPEELYVDFIYFPYVEADGSRSGIIVHGVDVTEQVHARREVERLLRDAEEARFEAEHANRAKAQFLAAMSHELRTPLNAIGGYVDLMDLGIQGPVSAAQRESLRRIAANQRHLLTLINDILTHAQLEAGRMQFHLRPVQVLPLLASVEALVAPLAEAKGIAYSIEDCPPDLAVGTDEERARQILLNLVTNAVKYTQEGGWIAVACERRDDTVAIDVRDNGRGIPADMLDAIFDPFMQVGRALNRPESGIGLGLAISRDLARGMDGELSVKSRPGEGSVFTLTLPAA